MTIFEELPALSPVQFFALSWDCPYLKKQLTTSSEYRLPSTAELLGEEEIAEFFMGWNEQKITIIVKIKDRPVDSIELFFDTRDLKTKANISKFCHHFIITLEPKDGVFCREITRFRNEDIHPLCDSSDLLVEVENSRLLKIEIPASCLFGYDPYQFQRLGFTYRVNREGRPIQHFAVSSEEFAVEQQPSLWGTLKLTGKK